MHIDSRLAINCHPLCLQRQPSTLFLILGKRVQQHNTSMPSTYPGDVTSCFLEFGLTPPLFEHRV